MASSNVADPIVLELIDKLDQEMADGQDKDQEWRRQHFKTLMLRWHPDKNRTETPEQANAVFRYLMAKRDRYCA